MDKCAINCRFCLEVDAAKNMVTPCDCRGSCAYVHKSCLSNWLEYTDTCNVCNAEYRLSHTWPSLPHLFQELFLKINNLTFDMIYLGIFMATFVPFIYTLVFFGQANVHLSSLQNHLLACIVITIGLIYMISLIEDCANKFFALIRRLSI